MLSRVANSLYWIGRYVERAENVSRLLLVASELSVEFEGLDEKLAQAEWDDLLAALPGSALPELDFSRESGLAAPYVQALLLSEGDPMSVRQAVFRARENARSIREVLTKEIFSDLNELYRELARFARRRGRDSVTARDEVVSVHRGILTALGSIEHTLSRDQGWTFMKLGEAMERSQRTLLVLRAKLPALLAGAADSDLPLVYARWRGLLRALASLENYRVVHGGNLDPDKIVAFLLFDRSAPRSVLVGVNRLRRYLDQLPGGAEISHADRILGRLHADLTYADVEIQAHRDLPGFCGATATALADAHEAICRQYFPS